MIDKETLETNVAGNEMYTKAGGRDQKDHEARRAAMDKGHVARVDRVITVMAADGGLRWRRRWSKM